VDCINQCRVISAEAATADTDVRLVKHSFLNRSSDNYTRSDLAFALKRNAATFRDRPKTDCKSRRYDLA
jgi:hypothetical protein